MKRILLALILLHFAIKISAQTICSAPFKGEKLTSYNNTVWVIGESDEKGKGVFKFENSTWYFFGMENAKVIAVTNSNQPIVLDHAKNAYLFNGNWNNIGSNISLIATGSNSSTIWAVIDNNLIFYKNNNWYETQYEPMLMKDINESGNGTIYALNGSGYAFKLTGNSWEILGNKKGESLYASANNEVFLLSDEFNVSGNSIYSLSVNNWNNTNYKGKSIAVTQNRAVYTIDGYNQIYVHEKGISKKISIDKITSTSTSSNTGGQTNFDYGNNVNFVDTATGETPLFKAVTNNDLPGIYTLLSKKADINKINKTGQTPLIKAITLDHTDVAVALIGLNADLEIIDSRKKNALSHACLRGDQLVVKELLKKGAKITTVNPLNDVLSLKNDNPSKKTIIEELINAKVQINSTHLEKTVRDNDIVSFNLLNSQQTITNQKPEDFNSYLAIAIENKNAEMIKACVAKGGDSNQAMNFAAQQNNKDLMVFCLQKGADANVPVAYAINNNDMDLFNLCLNDYKASKDKALQQSIVSKKKDFAEQALKLGASADKGMIDAIKTKDLNLVQLLFNYNASAKDSAFIVEAVKSQQHEIVKLLLSKGADSNHGTLIAIETQQEVIFSDLMQTASASNPKLIKAAAARDNIAILKLLLDKGSNPNDGILDAVSNNKTSNSKELIKRGANAKDENLIKIATENNYSFIAKLLIDNGADVNVALMTGIEKNRSEIVGYMIEKGADISNKELIIIAVKFDHKETAILLIDKGVNIQVKDANNNNLLHLAAKNYGETICNKLIKANKININEFNNTGHSPLMVVVMNGRGEDDSLCRLFVENGADINARDSNFETVYQLAKGRKVKKYLKDLGAIKK